MARASRHILLCGGTKTTGSDAADAEALRLDLWGKSGQANVSLHIEDIHAKLLRDVPETFQDLVEIATYVYCADQAVGRGRIDVDTFGSHWRRELEFHIPVRRLDFWKSKEVVNALQETVAYLTDDFYSFTFYPAQNAPEFQKYLDLPISEGPKGEPEQVMMFSGGLDSLAGAIQEAVIEKKRVLLVNHRSTDKLNRKHAELLTKLGQKAGAFMPGHLRVRVNKGSDITKDYHQRSRSFLYAALGGTVARMVRLKSLRFYENGVVALNLPVCAQVVGSRATRTAHPRVLGGFQRLLSLVAGEQFDVSNPFIWTTRGEAIKKLLDAGCGELVGPSMSCAHTWQISNEQTHCGMCSQCIDRRLGMIVAGAEEFDPIGHYRGDVFAQSLPNDMDKMMVATYLERANSVRGVATEIQFLNLFPEVLEALPSLDGSSGSALARVLDLYKRHAREVNKAVDTMMMRHVQAIRERTLPADCLLRIVYESASVTSVMTEGGQAAVQTGTTKCYPEVTTEVGENASKRKANSTNSEKLQEYVFRHTGDFWEIVFEGCKLPPVRHLAGLTYIQVLLSNPGKEISALSLYEIENPPPPEAINTKLSMEDREKFGTGGSHQPILDKLTSTQLKKAKAALEATLCDPDLSDNQKNTIEDRLEAINKALSNCQVARSKGGASFENKAKKQPRQTVSKSIDDAYAALAGMQNGQKLVKHLRYAIRKGSMLMYPPGLSWS